MFKNLLLIPFAYSNLTLIALLLLTVTSCSVKNSPVIYYNSFDFSQVNSYSFYQSGSEFFDSQNLSYAQRSRIELAIEKHLDSQSFHYSDLNSADIIVTYHIVEQSTANYKAYNKSVLFCAHCLRANSWIKGSTPWQVSPGSLIIDLVDPKNNRSVWRSIYPLNYQVEDNSMVMNEKITNAVAAMLSQYPRK